MYHPITSDIRHSGYDGNQPLPPSRGDMSLPHHQYRGGSNLSYPPAFPSMSHSAQGLGSQPMPWPSHVGPLQPERDSVQYILSGQYHHTNEARGDGMMNPTFVAHGQQSDLLSPTIHDMSRTRATAAPHSPSHPLYHPHPRQVEETLPTSPVESPLTPVSRKKSRRPKHRIELAPDQPLTTQGKPRARVFVACLQCRTRKIRCDGAKPTCHNCGRHPKEDDPCTYDAAPKRRGPDKVPGARQRTAREATIEGHSIDDLCGSATCRRRRRRGESDRYTQSEEASGRDDSSTPSISTALIMAPTHQSLLPMDPHFPEIPHYGVDGSVPLASTAQSHHQTLVTIPLGAAGLGY